MALAVLYSHHIALRTWFGVLLHEFEELADCNISWNKTRGTNANPQVAVFGVESILLQSMRALGFITGAKLLGKYITPMIANRKITVTRRRLGRSVL